MIPSAISNAVFDATGGRLRTAPFTPERVRRAMGGFSTETRGNAPGASLAYL